ncbi:LLM class flavin-dependent oxidoreductase [Paenibacillus taichungensis]|uniref:LLM class flavin-dependent oxidoreductase n=1 Tax=Paenibacillus taichungensis TaxID=484184 RepID=A0ABX2MIG4_9BACL|nr:LLM class flavin-dependent oxidoreductase [Paenibacillus taichungensis]NUU52692.1 LLM class flavin-dependent oxidoreductase [Paenibacillus taichungensis]
MKEFEFGIYSLGERVPDANGNTPTAQSRVEDIIQMAKMADEAGLDIFGVGEHHRLDFVTSSYALILAAIARETKNIKLTSTLSVISTADPVRVYEDTATLDLISDGRTEIILGRGAFLESFSLFGVSLNDYDELFEEKLNLFFKLQEQEVVNYWHGEFRSPLKNAQISPRPIQKEIPIWIGVGGTPASAVRAGRLGVNMALGLLSGRPESVKHLTDLYWHFAKEAGHDLTKLRVSVTGHSYVSLTGEQAITEFVPHYNQYFSYFLKERGQHFHSTVEQLMPQRAPGQILAVGSAEELAEKILYQHELFGHSRFMGQLDMGGQPLSRVEKAIDLLANKVAPIVRKALSK